MSHNVPQNQVSGNAFMIILTNMSKMCQPTLVWRSTQNSLVYSVTAIGTSELCVWTIAAVPGVYAVPFGESNL